MEGMGNTKSAGQKADQEMGDADYTSMDNAPDLSGLLAPRGGPIVFLGQGLDLSFF
jgi:hypothetical protein